MLSLHTESAITFLRLWLLRAVPRLVERILPLADLDLRTDRQLYKMRYYGLIVSPRQEDTRRKKTKKTADILKLCDHFRNNLFKT